MTTTLTNTKSGFNSFVKHSILVMIAGVVFQTIFSSNANANTIATGTVSGSPFCSCASIVVPYTSTGAFTAGNIFTVQLSDANGSFATPVNIGTLSSISASGNINALIPCLTLSGTLYRIRVVSDNPITTGTDNGVDLVINETPITTASATPSNICTGGSSQLNATGSVSSTIVYHVAAGAIVNCGNNCGNGPYSVCSVAQPGFTWTDIGSGAVSAIQVQFGQGVECAAVGTNHTTVLNGTTTGSFNSTVSNCACAYATPPIITINPAVGSYVVGGLNTFLVNTAYCYGFQNAGTLGTDYATITVTYGVPVTPTFSWSPTTNLSDPLIYNPVASGINSPITYTVTATANGCSAIATAAITIGGTPSTTITNSSATICAGGSSTLTANVSSGVSPYTFSWSPGGATTQVNTVSPVANTTYTVTVTDNCGSVSTANTTVSIIDPTPTVTMTPSNGVICSSGSVILTATGGATSYIWSPSAGLNTTTGSTVIASPTTTTTYTCTGIGSGSGSPITFTQTFVSGSTSTAQCTQWDLFRAQLIPQSYSTLNMRGTNDPVGVSVTDPTIAAQIAAALYGGTTGSWVSDGRTWNVGNACGGPPNPPMELSADGDVCQCSTGYIVRPCINNSNWGGINGITCSAGTQDMTVEFMPGCSVSSSVTVTVQPTPVVTASATPSSICSGGNSQLDATVPVATTIVYHVAAGAIVNCGNNCGNGPYSVCSASQPGFTWTDTGSGTVTSIQVQFGQGVECAAVGTTHTTVLNAVTTGSFNSTVSNCACAYATPPIITINPAVGSYVVGGLNTFLVNTAYCYGFQNAGTLGADYATITVTYGSTVTPTFSWSPITFLSNPNISNPMANGVTTTTTYTVTGTVNGCSGTATATVTVSGTPLSANVSVSASPICNGSSSTLTANVSGGTTPYTYLWSPGGQTTAAITDSPTSTTTYTVVVTSACGGTVSASGTVTVNQTPTQPLAISGNTTVCQGSTQTYSIAAVSGATSYTWTLPGGWVGTSTTTSITTTVGSTGGTISVTANSACGSSTAQTLVVTVTPTPAQPGPITGNASVCAGSLEIYSIAAVTGATSYTWTLPGGWTGTSTTTSINATVGVAGGTISVVANNACGSSISQTLIVTMGGGPPPSQPGAINGLITVCQGSSQTYSIASVVGATSYTWTLPAGWVGTSTTTSITATVGSTGGTISVTATNNCGTSIAQTLVVTVSPTPVQPGPITGNSAVCQGSSQTYSISPVAGATSYVWTLPVGWTGSSTTTSITATASANAGNITVEAVNACGTGVDQTLAVTISLLASSPGNISGTFTVCQGSTNTYTVNPVPGATSYTWTIPGGWSGTSTTNSITVIAASNSGNITVTANNACGSSLAQFTSVSVTLLPAAAGFITGDPSVCAGSSQVYFISSIANASSYSWAVPAGWTITAGNNTTTITVTVGANSGNVSVSGSNSCGTGTASIFNVVVFPLPPTPVITQVGPNLMSSAVSGNQWYRNSVTLTGATNQTYLPTQNGLFTVTVTDVNGCSATSLPSNYLSTDLNNYVMEEGINIYPNPATDLLYVEMELYTPESVKIYLINQLGQTVIMVNDGIESGSLKKEIMLNNIAPGIYFLKVQTNSVNMVKKIVHN